MKFTFPLILALSGLVSCHNDKPFPNIQTNRTFILVDSTMLTENHQAYNANDRSGYYNVFYIGNQTDTIKLRQEPIPPTIPHYLDSNIGKWSVIPNSNRMKIWVDTSLNLNCRTFFKHYSESQQKLLTDSSISFSAFPIFVFNLSDTQLFVGIFNCLGDMVRQAKNEKGEWVDIEKPIYFMCGTGARDIMVGPNEVLIAKLIRYKGDFRTVCRLKYQKNNNIVYSNTFIDFIDYRQLTDPL